MRGIKLRARDKRQTLRETILRALKADGSDIPNEMIVDRRLGQS